MKEKIKFIRLILSTILLSLLIISIFKSCSYAYSINELEDYLNYYKSEVDNGSTEFGNSYAIEQLYKLYSNHYQQFLILVDKLSNCVNPVFRINNNTSNGNIYYKLMDCTTMSISSNGGINVSYTYYNALTDSRGVGNFGSAQSGTSGSETIGKLNNIVYSSNLVDSNIITTLNSSDDYISQKQWTFIVNRGGTSPIYTNNNQNVNVFDIRIGQDWNINNVSLRIYTINNNSKEYRNNITYTLNNATNSNQYIVRFDVTNLDEDNTYYIELYYNNNLWRDTETGQRVIKNSTPVTPSGENTSGNIIVDLTQTNQKLDNINNSISNTNQLLISGEKKAEERQNFWQQAYETMFIPSGDKIETKINELKEHIGISGDISGELLILNNIKNNSGDFIIKWDTMRSHFSVNGNQLENQLTIPSGEINFSRIERENAALQNTMKWVRILLGFSLIVILIKQWWTLTLKTLGISTEVYEQHKEEEERLQKTQKTRENKK